jgi:hypothetical protein
MTTYVTASPAWSEEMPNMNSSDSIVLYTQASSGPINFSQTGQTLFLNVQNYNQSASWFDIIIPTSGKTGINNDVIAINYSDDGVNWYLFDDYTFNTISAPAITLPWSQAIQPVGHFYWQIYMTLGTGSTIQYSASYNLVSGS